MPDGIRSPASMDAWTRMLDEAQESIERALHEVDEHERWLDQTESAASNGTWPDAQRRCLEWIDERLRGLDGHQEVAGRLAADVETLLADDEHAASEWADRAATARRRLTTAAVGVS